MTKLLHNLSGATATCRFRIVSSVHHVSDARLQRLLGAASRAGFEVEIISPGTVAESSPSIRHTPLKASGRFVRIIEASRHLHGEVVLVPDPELFILIKIASLVGRVGLAICDVHENYSDVVQDRKWIRPPLKPFIRFLLGLVTIAAARADITLLADNYLAPKRAKNRIVILNRPIRKTVVHTQVSDLRAVYIGDVRESRGLSMMVNAIQNSPPWILDVIGPVNDERDALALNSAVSVCNRINLWGRQELSSAFATAKDASVGLCLLEMTPAFTAAMPAKIFEYVNSGLSIIATPLPRVKDFLEESGAGWIVEDQIELEGLLHQLALSPALLDGARRASRVWASKNLPVVDPLDGFFSRISQVTTRSMLAEFPSE